MSLTSSLFTGTSGMTNMGNAMQVIGDNVANVNTVGFKGNSYAFADLLSQSVATQSGTGQMGRGMAIGALSSTFASGSFESTGNTTDLSIGGDGFFVVRENDSERNFYTRAGNFNFDKSGYLVNPQKYVVQGWKLDSDTGEDLGAVTDILLESFTSPPKETDHIRVDTNLNADKTSKTAVMSNVWDATQKTPIASTNYEYQTVVKIYDSLGSTHDVTVYYDKKDGAKWEYMIACNPAEDQRNLLQDTTAQGILARGVITFSESSGSIENISMERLSGIVGNINTTGSISEAKTHFTINNYDTMKQDCYNISLQYDGAGWTFNTALRQRYPDAVITGDANGISINLDGDTDGVIDLSVKFDEAVQALDTVNFDINNPDGLHIQGITNTSYSGDAANDNTSYLIHNPEVLTDESLGNKVVWNAAGTTPFWSWGEIHTMSNFVGITAANTTFEIDSPENLVDMLDPLTPITLDYTAGAWGVTYAGTEYTGPPIPSVVGTASSVTLTLTPTGSATPVNITYTFKTPLAADGSFDVMTTKENGPVGYQTPLLAHGTLVGLTAADLDDVVVQNPAALVNGGPFGASFDGTSWTFAAPDPSASGVYGPSAVLPAPPATAITAGDGTGMTITLTDAATGATTDVVYTFNPPLTAAASFQFSTAAYDPNENAYANATLSGDETHALIDMNNDKTADIEFTFVEPLAKGAGASNSSINFDIKGGTAWQAQATNTNGYYEFMADFLGGEEGATEQKIEFNIGAKNDGTGQFISDSLTTTQYARASTTTFQDANGYGAGDLQGVDVSSDGVMTGIYSNGELIPLYRVALAKFLNNQGLFKEGGNLYRETRDSGSPITNRPGTNGLGAISPNSLEMSNVDMATEFVKMIVTQRGFQANSKVVTTVDTLLGEVINMKR